MDGLTIPEKNRIAVIANVTITKYRSAQYEFEKETIIRAAVYEAYINCKIKEEGI